MDYYQSVGDAFSKELLDRYNAVFPDGPHFTGGSGCTGMYRGIKLWEAAVTEAGSLDQAAVVAALDHAKMPRARAGRPRWCPASITCG